MERIKEKYKVFVFTDLGSGQINELKPLMEKAIVIIIDHHPAKEEINHPNLIHINCYNFGINGNT